jgi:hypothetical protein
MSKIKRKKRLSKNSFNKKQTLEPASVVVNHIEQLDVRFPIERSIAEDDFEVQEIFVNFLENIGCDGYGFAENNHKFLDKHRGGIITDLFVVRPYYWGNNEIEENKPNFEYYGREYINIDWYKYPLRSATSNKRLSREELFAILEDCSDYFNSIYN